MSESKLISAVEAARRRKFSQAAVRHGQYKTPEYWVWLAMRQRCQNPNHPCFPLYGGRNIGVCERWEQFENFIADMGKRPSAKHEIERLDNNEGYSPENCGWKTRSEQMRNTRNTILVTLNGKTLCVKDWCAELGVVYGLAIGRIRRGWTPERALSEPTKTQYRKKSYVGPC